MERVFGLVVLVMITSDYGNIADCFRRMAVGGFEIRNRKRQERLGVEMPRR